MRPGSTTQRRPVTGSIARARTLCPARVFNAARVGLADGLNTTMPAVGSGGKRRTLPKSRSSVTRHRPSVYGDLHEALASHPGPVGDGSRVSSAVSWGYSSRSCRSLTPSARLSRMRETQMRVPRMQGLPKHTLGSMEIRRSSSSRVICSPSATTETRRPYSTRPAGQIRMLRHLHSSPSSSASRSSTSSCSKPFTPSAARPSGARAMIRPITSTNSAFGLLASVLR